MKKLDVLQMEVLQGGTSPGSSFACGFGVACAIWGGPVGLLGLALCLSGDS